MSEGERLLLNHKKHVSLHSALRKRIEQCRAEMDRPEEVIENLAFSRKPLAEATESWHGSKLTDHIAVSYPHVYEQERREWQGAIRQLEAKLPSLQDILNLYEAIMVGLEPAEVWLIQEYFDKGRTLDDLAAEKDCVKSTMLTKKRRTVQKVDSLLKELCPEAETGVFCELSG